MKIAILGSGGLGGYFGGRLAAAGLDVAFIARGAHLAALRTHGLRIDSPKGNLHLPRVNATDDVTTVGLVDAVFFAVKRYDTESATPLLPPLIGSDTVVIPFQNGVDSADALIPVVGRSHVARGVAYVTAVVAEPGVIRHTAFDRIIFGEFDGTRSTRLERVLDACTSAGVSPELSERIEVDVWSKFVHLSVFSGMTAVTRMPVGALRDDPDLFAMWQAGLRESIGVAEGRHIPIPPTLFDDALATVLRLPPHAKASMLEDLERGRRLELPWLSAALVRMGGEVGVDTPVHRFIATVLRPHVNGRRS
jgi:2-dehydropantoate 2-reductase